MSTPTLSGPRFTLSAVPGSELEPVVHALADGTFIAVWVESSATPIGPDTSGSAIRAGFFNAAGEPIGSTFQVNNLFDNNQVDPDITVLTGGRFLVTWSAAGAISGDGNATAIKARILAADGTPERDEFQVNTYEINQQNNPSVTALDDGGFVVVYDSPLILGVLSFNVGAQFYNADGSPRGGEIKINVSNNGTRNVDVEQLSNGNVVFVWDVFTDGSSGQTDASGRAVFARVMTASGGPVGGDILVNTTTDDVQQTPRVAALTGGGFVVTWSDNSQTGLDTSSFAIRAQVFSNAGAPVGGEFLVNTTTANGQVTPVIEGLSDGRFIIAWTDGSVGASSDIRARLYNADGTPSGGEVLVTGSINGNQVEPSITELSDGRVLIGWRNVNDLAGQVIDPREAAINFGGTVGTDLRVGTRFNDRLDGLDGNDRLFGSGGNDTMLGGIGADTLFGDADNDVLFGFFGQDLLWGGAGNDTLLGERDNDILLGEAGNDVIDGGDENDTLYGFTGNDTLLGGNGADLIFAEADNDVAYGFFGSDTIFGGFGFDTLFGEQDNDILLGEQGEDVLWGGDGADTLYGFEWDDVLLGEAGDDVLFGEQDNDELYGWFGNDVLWGGVGNDLLLGEDGNDTFIGGLGRDTMTGGQGADRFFSAFSEIAAGEVDLITDFDAADRYLFQTGAQIQYFNFNAPNYVGAGIHVQVAGGVFILDVLGANASQLQAQTLFF